jgi:DNA gyrase/topoisomerase IV subunit B
MVWGRSGGGPACTSAAADPPGLHHCVWEILDNDVDDEMNR